MYSITETTKSCSKCQEVKLFAEFYKNKHTKSGLCSICKACEKAYIDNRKVESIARYKNYRTTHKKERAAYRAAHKEEKAAYNKTWWQAHPEAMKTYAHRPPRPQVKCRRCQCNDQLSIISHRYTATSLWLLPRHFIRITAFRPYSTFKQKR